MRVEPGVLALLNTITSTFGDGCVNATVSASMPPVMEPGTPSVPTVDVEWIRTSPASTISTSVLSLLPPASANVKVTLFGRAAAAMGRRAVSTAQVPSKGDAAGGAASAGVPWIKPQSSTAAQNAFMGVLRGSGVAAGYGKNLCR